MSSLLRFSLDDPSSITSLGITLMLMLMGFIYYYFYSNSSSSATKKQKSSSQPKIMVSTSTSSIQNSLVGMETRVKDVVSSLEIGMHEVRTIGIKGMEGAGKTTLARAVFHRLSANFEAKCFVENVREVSNASMFGLKKLQEQVLSNVLTEDVTMNGVFDGEKMMKWWMCGKKILLVLDDVDHTKQLEALAGERMWFRPGSRILITTRDEQVLIAHRVNVIHDIALLSEQEAICLFSRYAFETDNPVQGFEKLSENVVRYAAGLPLTVKLFGSYLCGKDEDEWVDAIERLKKVPLKETLKEAADLAGWELKNTLDFDGHEDKSIKAIVDKVTRVLNKLVEGSLPAFLSQLWADYYPRVVEVDLTPGSAFSFIIWCLLVFAGLKSQSVTGFPFKTHPNAIKVPFTSLLIYAFASMAELVVSVARLGHTSVYAIIARLGRISSLCLFVTSLAILIYI